MQMLGTQEQLEPDRMWCENQAIVCNAVKKTMRNGIQLLTIQNGTNNKTQFDHVEQYQKNLIEPSTQTWNAKWKRDLMLGKWINCNELDG